MRKLFLSIIALTLGIGAWAQETQSVNYIDADGQQKTVTATVVTNETGTLSAGWYVVTGEVSRGSITCDGAVHLILADGAKLTTTGGDREAGINVSGAATLTIYGQSAQSGQLFAYGGSGGGAGIGGGEEGSGSNITINGGTVTSTGGEYAAGIGGGEEGSGSNITINGGTVTANNEVGGAGIGGGDDGSGSNITINGGKITASGGGYGAGIGGGDDGSGSNITINGGKITASSGGYGAGIGGGMKGSGSYITINGGTITANGGESGSGIGGGLQGNGSNITINGGTVTANGGSWGAGIGGGDNGSGSNITINGDKVTANGRNGGASIGGGYNGAGSNIKVSADCHVFADGKNPPTTEIAHDSDTDLASALSAPHAFIEIDQTILSELRAEAIAAIDEVIAGVNNVIILDFAQKAKNSITNATNLTAITAIKDSAITELDILVKAHKSAFGELGEEHPGPAVKVTKGDTEVILYLPDKVEYIIRK